MLVCPENDGCADERAWLAARQPGLIVVIDEESSRDAFVATDGDVAFAAAVEAADYAVQDRQWTKAIAHLDEAESALASWPGTVENHLLVRMYVLRGAALSHLGRDGVEVAFRQAAASAWHHEPDQRGLETTDQFALDTERRKLITSGTGRLVVPGSARWWLDGVPVESREIEVLPGAHRLTAVESGKMRTFVAVVPVLPGRTVTVTPTWGPGEESDWFLGELSVGIATLSADTVATTLLADWCRRHEVSTLHLAQIQEVRVSPHEVQVSVAEPLDLRAPALAGEVLRTEEHIPATFEAAVAAQADAAAEVAPPRLEWRLRSAYFTAETRRFSAEAAPLRIANTDDTRRFSVGARVGYLRLADVDHAALDLALAWRLGETLSVRAEAGVAIAAVDYRFYEDWQDNKLLHAAASLAWSPHRQLAPLLAAGVELEAPFLAGIFAEAGGRAVVDGVWVVEAAARGSAGLAASSPVFGVGAGMSLARRW